MRKLYIIFLAIIALLFVSSCFSPNQKNSVLKVKGNCNMCKATIENSLKIKGIYSANWDVKAKVLKVSYDSLQINLPQIATYVAKSGYDNELVKADDKAYKKLHGCCQYVR
jgi:copper chaperone CopZ